MVWTSCTRGNDLSISALEDDEQRPENTGSIRTWGTPGGVETSRALAPARMSEAIVKALVANILDSDLDFCEGLLGGVYQRVSTSVMGNDCVLRRRGGRSQGSNGSSSSDDRGR